MDSQLNPEPDPINDVAPTRDSLLGWLRLNFQKLILLGAITVLICRYLHWQDVLLAGFGLSLIIFLHELGHFLAAKACDVHVRTFSIGFGPALPFCQYKYGETTYKIGMVPLGGFVAMMGENTGETDGEARKDDHLHDNDPRSFKNKTVPQRMLIISAGVIMNLLLAAVCFIFAYMNGVEEQPAFIQSVEPGSAAWKAGIRPGTEITNLNGLKNPWFDDIKPYVMATRKGDTVTLETMYKGKPEALVLEPQRGEGALFPQLGIAPPSSLTLMKSRRDEVPQYEPNSAPASAKNADGRGPGFLGGDTILAVSNPRDPNGELIPLEAGDLLVGQIDYRNRLAKLAGQPIRYRVLRASGETAELIVPPAFHKETGLRMKMGPIVAVRADSPAAKADVKSYRVEGDKELEPGDRIVSVEVAEADGKRTLYSVDPKATAAQPNTTVQLLDPLKIPFELNRWANSTATSADRSVQVVVLRNIDRTDKNVTLNLVWDDGYREDFATMIYPSTPLSLGGLGIAYRVTAEVNQVIPDSAAAKAGILPNDLILSAKFKRIDPKKKEEVNGDEQIFEEKPGKDSKPKFMHWAYVDYVLQTQAPHKMVDLVIDRAGQEVKVASLDGADDPNFPVPADGLAFGKEMRLHKANGPLEALEMGYHRTLRAIRATYQGLYGMVFGRISFQMMSGPITLARASYILAGQDIWKLVLLVGLISINLAVVNFLPIPVLDGGHMVFLIYEGIFRKPAPEIVQVILTWIGLIAVLSLMLFTIGLDLWRVWKDWHK